MISWFNRFKKKEKPHECKHFYFALIPRGDDIEVKKLCLECYTVT